MLAAQRSALASQSQAGRGLSALARGVGGEKVVAVRYPQAVCQNIPVYTSLTAHIASRSGRPLP